MAQKIKHTLIGPAHPNEQKAKCKKHEWIGRDHPSSIIFRSDLDAEAQNAQSFIFLQM